MLCDAVYVHACMRMELSLELNQTLVQLHVCLVSHECLYCISYYYDHELFLPPTVTDWFSCR